MTSNRKIIFTVSKEEYEIVSNFFKFIDGLDTETYDDVREVIMDYDNTFYDMVGALVNSFDCPKTPPTPLTEAIQTIANYCENNRDCKACPLIEKCCDEYPYNWVNISQS